MAEFALEAVHPRTREERVARLDALGEARALGAPSILVARMLANVAIEGILGAVPLVADAFDVAWRANVRNLAPRDHLDRLQGCGARGARAR